MFVVNSSSLSFCLEKWEKSFFQCNILNKRLFDSMCPWSGFLYAFNLFKSKDIQVWVCVRERVFVCVCLCGISRSVIRQNHRYKPSPIPTHTSTMLLIYIVYKYLMTFSQLLLILWNVECHFVIVVMVGDSKITLPQAQVPFPFTANTQHKHCNWQRCNATWKLLVALFVEK